MILKGFNVLKNRCNLYFFTELKKARETGVSQRRQRRQRTQSGFGFFFASFASFASFAILPSPSNLIYVGIGSHWLPLLSGNHVLNFAPVHLQNTVQGKFLLLPFHLKYQ